MMKRNSLSHRSVLSLTGADRYTFLQGLLTQDMMSLSAGEICWTGLLNVQGRIQCLFFIFCTEEELFLDLPAEQAETTYTFLKRFRLRADVNFAWVDKTICVGTPHDPQPDNALCCATDPRHPHLGWRALMPPSTSEPHSGDILLKQARLALGIPDMEDLIPGQTLALEANLDACHGVSWDKGCYLGQEVTARMHYRSRPKRRLLPIHCPQHISFPVGSPLTDQGHEVGELRSSLGAYGLAMVHYRAWHAETLSIEDTLVSLHWPEWLPSDHPSSKDL